MRTVGWLSAAVGAALLAGLVGAPPGRAGDPEQPPVAVLAPAEDTVCPALFGYTDGTLKRKTARAIMTGAIDMGDYGAFTLATDPITGALVPDWSDRTTLDLAGDRYLDALRWTVPLLRVGRDLANPEGDAMVEQFMALLRSWVATHPRKERDAWMNHPQYGGFRLATFVCGVREVPDAADNAWLVKQARIDLDVQLGKYFLAGANNTMLNSQVAAFAAAMTVGTTKQQKRARSNLLALAAVQTHRDGSDREGAPGYGLYAATILSRVASVLAA
jgi:hypothetical protein